MNFAGKTNIPVNTYVRVTSSDDPDVEGLEGRITHTFPGLKAPGVEYIAGLRLNDNSVFSGGICNLTDEDVIENCLSATGDARHSNRAQKLVLLIADYLTDWTDDVSSVVSVEDSIKAIESYGELFHCASSKLVTNAIRHFIDIVNPWNKSAIPDILMDIGFTKDECEQYMSL